MGTRVRIKDTYCDEACTIPLVGTVKDILDDGYPDEHGRFDGVTRYVVLIDEEPVRAAGHDPRMFPPGGEFSEDRLAPA
jgi:hypothetical protein